MRHDLPEFARVSAIGTIGWIASIQLADVATLVSIGVGLATLTYVIIKTYFLIKHDGGGPK